MSSSIKVCSLFQLQDAEGIFPRRRCSDDQGAARKFEQAGVERQSNISIVKQISLGFDFARGVNYGQIGIKFSLLAPIGRFDVASLFCRLHIVKNQMHLIAVQGKGIGDILGEQTAERLLDSLDVLKRSLSTKVRDDDVTAMVYVAAPGPTR